MRRKNRRLLLVFVAPLAACASHPVGDRPIGPGPYAAEWVEEQITEFERDASASANRVDGKVVFDGTSLYLIHSPCCDLFNYLYTADGKAFCAPSGGFAGGGDHKCPPNLGPVQRRSD